MEGGRPLTVGRVGSAGGSSSLGLSSGLPIPLCLSASSICSIELSADDSEEADAAIGRPPHVRINPKSMHAKL